MIMLDASALLAFLFKAPGHEAVAEVLDGALVSTVSLAEVLSRFARDGHDPVAVVERLAAAGLQYVGFNPEAAIRTAALAPLVRSHGLSMGDRACLALAAARGLPALTANHAWGDLGLDIDIQFIH